MEIYYIGFLLITIVLALIIYSLFFSQGIQENFQCRIICDDMQVNQELIKASINTTAVEDFVTFYTGQNYTGTSSIGKVGIAASTPYGIGSIKVPNGLEVRLTNSAGQSMTTQTNIASMPDGFTGSCSYTISKINKSDTGNGPVNYALQEGDYDIDRSNADKAKSSLYVCPEDPKRFVISSGPEKDLCIYNNMDDAKKYCNQLDSCIGFLEMNNKFTPIKSVVKSSQRPLGTIFSSSGPALGIGTMNMIRPNVRYFKKI